MKKAFLFIIISTCLFLTGCDVMKDGTMTCTRKESKSGISLDLSYTVDYADGFVTKISSSEKITADDSSVLDLYKEKIEEQFEPYKDVEYYNYDVSIKDNTLSSKTIIEYDKIDTSKMIEIDSNNGQLIKNGKISIKTLKSYYESLNISCEN